MFHDLLNYDLHFIFQEVGRNYFKINVIPKLTEKYMNFTTEHHEKKDIKLGLPLAFIDSVHFLDNSLDNLVTNLEQNKLL